MKIALLGYGKEGRATEEYFKKKGAEIVVFENFAVGDLEKQDFSDYDLVFRSPSVPFRPPVSDIPNLTSVTRYFFDHCPCPIIGVTASKGKGTTCSFAKSLLESFGEDVHLVGNIGVPAISELDNLKPTSVVVYEMSSFQLWDLEKSPEVAVIGTIAPDHLNVHNGFADYTHAKSNICRHQSPEDYTVYYKDNPDSVKIAESSASQNRLSYPYAVSQEIKDSVKLPGEHNLNNALGALAAVASYFRKKSGSLSLTTSQESTKKDIRDYLSSFIADNLKTICAGLSSCQGLPHRLQFLRDLDGISYYDDNFSTNPASTRVAVQAFPDRPIVLIAGGRDKTKNADLPEIAEILNLPNIAKVVLIGESGHEIFQKFKNPDRFISAESLETAVLEAKTEAEKIRAANLKTPDISPVVLMSPAAASFDMFKDVYDRGAKYQNLIKSLE